MRQYFDGMCCYLLYKEALPITINEEWRKHPDKITLAWKMNIFNLINNRIVLET